MDRSFKVAEGGDISLLISPVRSKTFKKSAYFLYFLCVHCKTIFDLLLCFNVNNSLLCSPPTSNSLLTMELLKHVYAAQ